MSVNSLIVRTSFLAVHTLENVPSNTPTISIQGYDRDSQSFSSASSPPVTKVAQYAATLVAGALTIDFTALPLIGGGTQTMLGLKLNVLRAYNPSAHAITVAEGASNGYAGVAFTLQPGEEIFRIWDESLSAVAAGDKTLDLTGTLVEYLYLELGFGVTTP